MTTENTLREGFNEVNVEGVLLEKRIELKTFSGKESISGEIDVEIEDGEVHTINLFSNKLKKDGTENGNYKGLKTIMDEYKSVADVGKEEADKVRITDGKIGLNEYFSQNGELKSYPKISTNFVNRVKASENFTPKAEFKTEVFVKSVLPEEKNHEETGRVVLKGYIPLYGGKLIPFSFVVTNKEAIDYVEENYEPGTTVKINGEIINKVEIKKTVEAVAFGKPQESITRKTTREYVISGGSDPYEEENKDAYSMETIKKALTEREIHLEELKNKKNEPKQEEKKKGFDTKSQKEKVKFDMDKLPF